jgi:restriction system protein
MERWNAHRETFVRAQQQDERDFTQLRAAWDAGRPDVLEKGVTIAVANSNLWWSSKRDHQVRYDPETKTLLVECEFPDVEKFQFYKQSGSKQTWKPVAKTRRRELQEKLLYGLALTLVFDLADITRGHAVEQIALNGHATFTDKTTGREKTADLSQYSPVIPIMTLDRDDRRIVAAREVMEGLRENENIAAMEWIDFEHLVRELFEKEFTQEGMEVKITRASRDSGVDAIAFDPDPLRGGKFVIQAKRYTRTVDVSAVRDLYGTLQNEGANRGILVTTSKFGRDSYEFAQGKPITLIDGPNLLAMLLRHGYKFCIDLEAAKRLGA